MLIHKEDMNIMVMTMRDVLARYWWVLLIRGIVAIIFGLLALLLPRTTLLALVYLFGAYALVDGIFAVVAALGHRGAHSNWGWMLIGGIIGIIIGVLTFLWPGITALVLLYLIAFWAILIGIYELSVAFGMRLVASGEWLLVLSGILSIILGILLLFNPIAGGLALVTVVGAYAIIIGIILLIRAFRLRTLARA